MLVDPRHLQPIPVLRLLPQPDPVNNTLSLLDLEMKHILYSDLCDSEKFSQYNQILTWYRDTYVKTWPPIDKPHNTDNINSM